MGYPSPWRSKITDALKLSAALPVSRMVTSVMIELL
jgi:hypothetical protein